MKNHPQQPQPSDVTGLAEAVGLSTTSPLFVLALTHRSYAFESGDAQHNERLEFLGDSVLGLVVTSELYERHPTVSEGDLARIRAAIVNTHSLARVARSLNVGPCILLDKGEQMTGGANKSSILADTMEALIGAIYLEHGVEQARSFIVRTFQELFVEASTTSKHTDWKTALQEFAARQRVDPPRYEVTSVGPDHAKHFTAVAMLDGKAVGRGEGSSKKAAEQLAAHEACTALNADDPTAKTTG